ncbi:MAG: two-component sensor histidine kinase [Deltaproteobacteria bacterium]|nr:two-component sensor histidine kinase [Deltaproteobacteria bacterium]
MAHGVGTKAAGERSPEPLLHERRYRRLFVSATIAIALTAILPLIVMTVVNYLQYEEAFHTEMTRPIARLVGNAKKSLEFILAERLSALGMVIRERPLDDLRDPAKLGVVLANMKHSFGGFVDLGLIDETGRQVAYAGPYDLQGKEYRGQDWFDAVRVRGVYVSDVFMGYRNFPHFVVAVKGDTAPAGAWILRATIDTELFNRQLVADDPRNAGDAFVINREGVLQTPSRHYGAVLGRWRLAVPPYAPEAQVVETEDASGEPLILGYAYVEGSPFIVIELGRPGTRQASWLALRRNLVLFLVISVVLIAAVVAWGTRLMVHRIREADVRRAAVFHKMEYTNKMAAIGRLGAGVAHEINNPLAIIGEKAGLMKDLLTMSPEPPSPEKLVGLADSVLGSVERCSRITHRLLGFAKHMDVRHERIEVDLLLREVLGFLEKEASYRGVKVEVEASPGVPAIESDRGQLQQVFLNILNNAFAAVEQGGRIRLAVTAAPDEQVAIEIEDNGVGIPAENLAHIFEPFFTTKKGQGTGLGLSITYGIVEKLGGRIAVRSEVGEGTVVSVTLPVRKVYA